MSTCDRCFSPGACCRDLVLSDAAGQVITLWEDEDPVQALEEIMGPHWFVPLGAPDVWTVSEDDPRRYISTRWSCTALGFDGRCTVYEDRPQLCRNYEAGSDPMCVHWRGAEGDERSVL